MHTVIILNEQDTRFKFIPAIQHINSQIIIKDEKYAYNFNADISEAAIGECYRSDELLIRLGCEIGKKYKREITLDPPQLMIICNDAGPDAEEIMPTTTYNNVDSSQILITVEK